MSLLSLFINLMHPFCIKVLFSSILLTTVRRRLSRFEGSLKCSLWSPSPSTDAAFELGHSYDCHFTNNLCLCFLCTSASAHQKLPLPLSSHLLLLSSYSFFLQHQAQQDVHLLSRTWQIARVHTRYPNTLTLSPPSPHQAHPGKTSQYFGMSDCWVQIRIDSFITVT